MTPTHRIDHEAMNTVFTLRLVHDDSTLARNAARDAVALLDEIEGKLSRYHDGSDVWQINHLQPGTHLFLSDICYDCLRIAFDAWERTGGLFDITLGRQIEHRKTQPDSPPPPLAGQLILYPDRPAIQCIEAGRELDLGGIGKGFALDQMKICLRDWGVESGLLSAGNSTQLAFGSEPWTIDLLGSRATHPLPLANKALSTSGLEVQGTHIISPSDPAAVPPRDHIWVTSPLAAIADAFSTAAMLMDDEALDRLVREDCTIVLETKTGIRRVGR